MGKFAFLFHPYDIAILADQVIPEPILKTKNRLAVEGMLKWLDPIKRDTVSIVSSTGETIEGEIILVSLISEQILNLDNNFVLKKTVEAGKLAKKLGAKIVGLGAYLAGVGRRGVLISEAIDLPVTTGTSYTIAIAIEATLKAAKDVGIDVNKAHVTIVGATGSIGKICSTILANQIASLTLVARNREKLESLAEYLRHNCKRSSVKFTDNVKDAVKNADIVILSTTTPSAIITGRDLTPGSVVCDISIPHNISKEEAEENNILVIDGGLVKCPSKVDFSYLALAPGLAYACLSEVMVLTFEKMYTNYSIGGNATVINTLKINQLAAKHGFKLAEFRSFGKPVNQDQIENVKKARLQR